MNRKVLSAAVMKNIALITMTIDHVTAFLVKMYLQNNCAGSYYNNDWYVLGRVVGRIAFVLYAFMIAEGAVRTKNKIKYAGRLLILAVVSVVPHSIAHSLGTGSLNRMKYFDPSDLNIFFLLFTGLVTIYIYQYFADNIKAKALSVLLRIVVIAAACALSNVLNFEYGLMGILLIMAFYICRNNIIQTLIWATVVMAPGYMLNCLANKLIDGQLVSWFNNNQSNLWNALWNLDRIQFWGVLAFPIIVLYSGKKGKQLPKWFYYFFYPVHLAIIALILYLNLKA